MRVLRDQVLVVCKELMRMINLYLSDPGVQEKKQYMF